MPSAERLVMYTMLSGQIMNNLAIRFGLPGEWPGLSPANLAVSARSISLMGPLVVRAQR